MSAVFKFVEEVVEDVVDAVGDVVESVVDVVGDALEFVGDTVQAVLDDPLPVLLSVAGSFIGIPPMVTNALVTAGRGGDLGDIALSMGTSYFAPAATNAISSTLSSTIGSSIINETVSNTVVDAVSRGLVSGTIAELRDGDFTDGFAGGFVGTVVGAGVNELSNFVSENVLVDLPDLGAFGTIAEKAITSGITAEITDRTDFNTAFTSSFINNTANVGANYLTSTISEQFNATATADQTLNNIEDDTDYVDISTPLDDSWNDTSGVVGTGAGIPDELVDEVEVSNIGQDTPSIEDDPMVIESIADDVIADDLINATLTADLTGVDTSDDVAETTVQDIAAEDVTDLVDQYTPPEGDDALFTELTGYDTPTEIAVVGDDEVVGDEVILGDDVIADSDVSDLVSAYTPSDREDLSITEMPEIQEELEDQLLTTTGAPTVPEFEEEELAENLDGLGGLSIVGGAQEPLQEEEPIVQVASRGEAAQPAIRPEDLYEDVSGNLVTTPIDETEKPTDVFGRPVGGLQTTLTRDAGGAGRNLVTGALNQILKPALRQGITKTLKRQVARPAARPQPKRPAQVKAAPRKLSATQLAALQNRPRVQAPNAAAAVQAKKPVAQKVDVSTLSPLKDITSLTALLAGGKGQG
jgi:hypothetical protein